MSKLVEELKKKLDSMTQEELDQEWEKLKEWNNVGPTVEEYLENLKKYGLYPKELNNMSKSEEYRQNKYYCDMCMDINCDGCGVKTWLKQYSNESNIS